MKLTGKSESIDGRVGDGDDRNAVVTDLHGNCRLPHVASGLTKKAERLSDGVKLKAKEAVLIMGVRGQPTYIDKMRVGGIQVKRERGSCTAHIYQPIYPESPVTVINIHESLVHLFK